MVFVAVAHLQERQHLCKEAAVNKGKISEISNRNSNSKFQARKDKI
jgi:hypothetical protein